MFCDLMTHVVLSLEGAVRLDRARQLQGRGGPRLRRHGGRAGRRRGRPRPARSADDSDGSDELRGVLFQLSRPTATLRQLYAEQPRWAHSALQFSNTAAAALANSEETLSNLIALAVETEDLDRVRDYGQRLLKISPQSPAALQGLAAVALERQDHHAAARYCDRMVQLAPDCLEAWHNLRVALDRILTAFNDPKPAAAGLEVR